MGKMSRNKGKRGEREVVDLFKDHGFDARRTSQVDGGLAADVLVPYLKNLHIEVKRHYAIASCRFMDQAVNDMPFATSIPTVFMREDNGGWIVMMQAIDYMTMLKAIHHG